MTGSKRYWSDLKRFLSKYICLWKSFTLPTLSQKLQILNAWKGNFRESYPCKFIFYLFLKLWMRFAFTACFYTWKFPDFCFTSLWRFIYPACLLGLPRDSAKLSSPYIYNILNFCNILLLKLDILFLCLHYLFLVIQSLFIGMQFWANVLVKVQKMLLLLASYLFWTNGSFYRQENQ